MDVKQILCEYLTEHGYDGLYLPALCACEVADLAPCGEDFGHCRPGYKYKLSDTCEHDSYCSTCAGGWGIRANKD